MDTKPNPLQHHRASAPPAVAVQALPPTCNSHALFGGGNELVILHHGEPYRLRQTRQGKLILTK